MDSYWFQSVAEELRQRSSSRALGASTASRQKAARAEELLFRLFIFSPNPLRIESTAWLQDRRDFELFFFREGFRKGRFL